MTRYESYNIDNDMWYKKRKHIYHLMGVYDGGRCACIIATYSLKTKRLLIKGANKHIPESSILKQFIEYAESKELQEKQDAITKEQIKNMKEMLGWDVENL